MAGAGLRGDIGQFSIGFELGYSKVELGIRLFQPVWEKLYLCIGSHLLKGGRD